MICTNFPSRPRFWNLTVPWVVAKSVSSLPRPTLRPALIGVPRWRTKIEPLVTNWPSNRFTPSRLDWLSRPFLELPSPFLCAIVLYPSEVSAETSFLEDFFVPPKSICSIRTPVKTCRWPLSRRYILRRLNL